MTTYRFGEVVLINFPQSGQIARKQRPAIVVLDVGDMDVVVAPVTSKARAQAGDRPLSELAGTGLVRSSWVRLGKVTTLLKTDVIRVLGRLGDPNRAELNQEWASLYGGFVT
jgi:mRNA-degrading endonuclease toxin of MazEF toxin-antitoxin module